MHELQRMVDNLEKSEPVSHNKCMIAKLKQLIEQHLKSKACADVGLIDESLFSRSLAFFSSIADHMMRLLDPVNPFKLSFPLPGDPSPTFRLMPEWVVNDMSDFLLFGLKFLPNLASTMVDKFKNLGEKVNMILAEKIRQDKELESVPARVEYAILGETMEGQGRLLPGKFIFTIATTI